MHIESLKTVTCAALLTLCAASCVKKPVTAPRAVVPETVSAEIHVAASPGKDFGNMVALGVGISSGEQDTYVVSADRIFAVDDGDNRIAPLSVEEAARQAGGATALAAGLEGAGGGALLTGLLGAIPGAIIGAAQSGGSGAGTGAAVGAGIGIAVGAIGGFHESKSKTEQEIIDQLHGLYFGEQTLKTALPVSGFVFYPAGKYIGVRAIVVDQASKQVKEIFGPMVPKP
jgi:hypothetical protein